MNYVGGIITILFLFEPRKIIFACAVNNRARISIFPTSASVQTRGGGLGRDVKAGYLKPTFRLVNHATGLLGISFRWHNGAICIESPERSKWLTTFPSSWRNQRLTPIQWLDGFHLQFISLLSSTTLWICFPLSFNSSSDFFFLLETSVPGANIQVN